MSTLQAQAIRMMNGLSDEHIASVIEFIQKLSVAKTKTQDGEVSEKMKAFQRLQSRDLNFPEDFDPDKERMEALREKYGSVD